MIDDTDPQERPSKSQRKREAHAQQALGQRLTSLTSQQLQRLPLPGDLRNALEEYQRLPNSRGARKRQLQFIGRLMREVDHEGIAEALEQLSQGSVSPTAPPATDAPPVDSLCKKILSGGDTAIEATLVRFPTLDRQRLRQLALAHHRASTEQRPEVARKLAAYLESNLPRSLT